jgi:hypothetical protein
LGRPAAERVFEIGSLDPGEAVDLHFEKKFAGETTGLDISGLAEEDVIVRFSLVAE